MKQDQTEVCAAKGGAGVVKVRTGSVKLEVLEGDMMEAKSFQIAQRETVIGRGESSGIRVAHARVSRRHAKLILDVDGIAKIVDLQSTNGTMVNGTRINIEVLRDGDKINVGGAATFVIRYEYFESKR